jgi:hypothetical protein
MHTIKTTIMIRTTIMAKTKIEFIKDFLGLNFVSGYLLKQDK